MSLRPAEAVLSHAFRTPWMITEDGLALVLSVISRTNDTPEALALRDGDPLPRRRSTLRPDGTLLLPILGPLVPRADMFARVSGATDVRTLRDELATAIDTAAVERVLLVVDSPGGAVTGVTELARMIRATDAVKPVYAYVEGTAASAAYYLASAARELTGAPMSLAGAIGVRMAITHRAQAAETATFEFVSSQSPNKGASPSTDAGRAQLQQLVDDLAAVFLADVGRFRGLSADQVQTRYGAGAVVAASRALEMGLIDQIATQDATLERIAGLPRQPAPRPVTTATPRAARVTAPVITQRQLTQLEQEQAAADRLAASEAAAVARIIRAHAQHTGGN